MTRRIVLLCIFLSGAAGLVYEVVWIQRASLVYGSTTPALSTVLGVFFGGLALGAWLFGRVSPRLARPLMLYGWLEIILAGVALLATAGFGLADRVFGAAYVSLAGSSVAVGLVRTGLVALLLLPPAALMGGTLPLICRHFVMTRERTAATVARLYALNTLGAAAGCALAGFVLLPTVGLWGAACLGAGFNLTAGLGVLLSRQPAPACAPLEKKPGGATTSKVAPRIALVAVVFAVLGFTSLAGEILWTRFLTLLVHDTVHTWTITLTVVLVGIVIGSWIVGRLDRRLTRPALLLGVFMGAVALAAVALPSLPVSFWRGFEGGVWPFVVVLLPPSVLAGACLPVAMRLVAREPESAGFEVGRLTAVNTLGGIAGSLATGFVLLPAVGLATSLVVVGSVGIAGALISLLVLPGGGRRAGPVIGVVLAAGFVAVPLVSRVQLPADYLAPSEQLVAWAEGRASTLAAVNQGDDVVLQIDRLWQGRDARNHQVVAAHVPALLHPDPRRVCVVGLGVGQTASRFLMHGAERLDCVDIEPALFAFVREHFDAAWLDDPRVRVIGDDGRTFVAHGRELYDLVSIEVGQTFRPGAAAFYTREFYRAVHGRLADGGLVAQFVPLPFLDEVSLRSIVATFVAEFPTSVLWYNTAELLLIGGERLTIDPVRLATVEERPQLRADLAYSQWGGVEFHLHRTGNLLGGFLCGPTALARLAAGAEPLTDNRPRLAYATRNAAAEDRRASSLAPILAALAEPVSGMLAVPVDSDVLAIADRVQRLNLADLTAADHVAAASDLIRERNLRSAAREIDTALRVNPESAEAVRIFGDIMAQAGRNEDAAHWLRYALALRPDDAIVQRNLGATLVILGQHDEAERLLQSVVRLRPRDTQAWNALGAAFGSQGRAREAAECFATVMRLEPNDASARRNLKLARKEMKRREGVASSTDRRSDGREP